MVYMTCSGGAIQFCFIEFLRNFYIYDNVCAKILCSEKKIKSKFT